MDDDFYLRFENKFRGPRDLIRQRVTAYLPIIAPLKVLYPEGLALDLGCGRGEWLELLRDNAWPAKGIDTNQAMFDACRALGLQVESGDALEYLKGLPGEEVVVVSGFHIAEHLAFEDLRKLVSEAFRVLKPGGILILETPNPENLLVGACNFYMDPTHRHPLPPPLMEFLAEDSGFFKIKTLRLNGGDAVSDEQAISEVETPISRLLLGHPDYALVAQKQPPEQSLSVFLELDQIGCSKAMKSLGERVAYLDHEIPKLQREMKQDLRIKDQKIQQLEFDLQEKNLEVKRLEKEKLSSQREKLELEKLLEAKGQELLRLERTLNELVDSHSWRVMRPFRLVVYSLRKPPISRKSIVLSAKIALKPRVKRVLHTALRMLQNHPTLKTWLISHIKRFPPLDHRLRRVADLAPRPNVSAPIALEPSSGAEKIYQELKREIEARRKAEI